MRNLETVLVLLSGLLNEAKRLFNIEQEKEVKSCSTSPVVEVQLLPAFVINNVWMNEGRVNLFT